VACARCRDAAETTAGPPGAEIEFALAERACDGSYSIAQGAEPAGHLPTLNVGCQKLRGQKRIEMKY